MVRQSVCSLVAILVTAASLGLVIASPPEVVGAEKNKTTFRKPIKNPPFDPDATQVNLFEAVDSGKVTVRLIPKNARGGKVLIENKLDQPLTVKIPEAVAAVSIHSQFANAQMDNNAQAAFGFGKAAAGDNAGPQNLGGGIMPLLQNKQAAGNEPGKPNVDELGQGLFSIPAESVISLPFSSVCLEHGKPEPTTGSKYTLVPINRISRDPVLHQLIATVGRGGVDQQAAQAAAWHVANGKSFQELSEMITTPIDLLTQTPHFSVDQIIKAEQLVARARERSEELSVIEATAKVTSNK
ncbi:hypothetical protein [Schlesneria sp. T3-172]|uniref:hypothetical protein n=1 Tax=Schlesneria sphaerica TaxID=3373610 RepID=UPI0037C5A906